MGVFEKYLSLWIALAMAAGIGIGSIAPGLVTAVAAAEVAKVNLIVAVLVWAMVYPMMVGVDPGALRGVLKQPRGLAITLVVNWLIKPFTMAALGVLFFEHVFADRIAPADAQQYIAGLILLGAAPCTAMVFVWSNLTRGEPHFTLSQVALNDIIMVFAFGPIVGLLLGMTSIVVPWDTLFLSVVLYIAIPLIIAQVVRGTILKSQGPAGLARLLDVLGPSSLIALLTTLVLLFGFQGEQIVKQPLVILLLAIPILFQVFFNAGLAYWLNRQVGSPHCVAGPSALIGASNFFELAVAAAIALFGFESGAALATVVGVLIEVPVMLIVAGIVNRSRAWYERSSNQPATKIV